MRWALVTLNYSEYQLALLQQKKRTSQASSKFTGNYKRPWWLLSGSGQTPVVFDDATRPAAVVLVTLSYEEYQLGRTQVLLR